MSAPLPRRPNSLRLKDYDYSQSGAYHITVNAIEFGHVFGIPQPEDVALNATGLLIETLWQELPDHYVGVQVDVCKVMPDHFHGLLLLYNPEDFKLGAAERTLALPDVVQRFKSLTTHQHRLATGVTKLWRRGYWDEIITSQQQFEAVQRYIYYNAHKDYLKRNGLL